MRLSDVGSVFARSGLTTFSSLRFQSSTMTHRFGLLTGRLRSLVGGLDGPGTRLVLRLYHSCCFA